MFYGLLASRLTGTVFINAMHNARKQSAAVRLLRRACMKYSNHVIALTERHKGFIARYYRLMPDIPHRSQWSGFNRFPLGEDVMLYRANLNLPLDKPIVAIIATLLL